MFAIKRIAAAAALAAVASTASAAFTAGDLVLMAYDSVNGKTFLEDLGITTFDNTTSIAGLSGGADWTSFFVAADVSKIVWDIIGGDTSGASNFGYTTYSGTVASGPSAGASTAIGAYNGLFAGAAVSAATGTTAIETVATEADHFSFIGNAINYGYTTDGALGASLKTSLVTVPAAAKTVITTYSPLASLSTGGVLTIAAAAPAVPEPGTWALMAAGLLTVGAIARRRNAA